MSSYQVICGDALLELPALIERGVRVSLVNADIPYFKVKSDEWDRQWKSEGEFLQWVDTLCGLLTQILLPNGSLYLYASPQMARKVGNVVAEHFQILTDIRWRKPPFSTKAEMFRKEDLRAPFPASETIFFAEQFGAEDAYRAEWMAVKRAEFGRAGLNNREVAEAAGCHGAVNHGGSVSNWLLGYNCPTREQYARLRAELGDGFMAREYDDLRALYDASRADEERGARFAELRRPFSITADVPYTDVWDFPTVLDYPGKHPCEKPPAMMAHIVRASSREGDLVLDLCAGSGVFGEQALASGRSVIAIEREERWARKAQARASRYVGGSAVSVRPSARVMPVPPLFALQETP